MARFMPNWFQRKIKPDASGRPRTRPERVLREWLIPFGIVVAVMVPIRSVIADWNDVPTGSMRPTILEGDRIYVNKLAFGLRVPLTHLWLARWNQPSRGDIVTFASPSDGTRLVKRIVGIPGDTVALDHNILYVNGVPSQTLITDPDAVSRLPNGARIPAILARENLSGVEHAIVITPALAGLNASFGEIVVPPGMYFFMGDNRDQSNDSRFIGMVREEDIYGRCPAVALSLDPDDHYAPRWDRFFSGLK